MLTSGKHPMQNRPIHAFRDCDVSTKASIRDCFTSWGKVVMDDPAPLSDEELEQHADQLVFDGWDAFMKPDAPSFEAPQVSATRVQIGYFSKNLPDPSKARLLWETGLHDDLFQAARNTSNIELPVLHGRAIGQPAFVRARPEWQEQVLGVPFDFYDRHGKWAPIASIDFKTPDNKPSEILLATACDRADTAWANACDDWNVNLCIYLCRCRVYNKCHRRSLDKPEGLSEAQFRPVSVPRIRDSMPTTLERIQKISILSHARHTDHRRGRAVFAPRATHQSANVKSEDTQESLQPNEATSSSGISQTQSL